MILLEGKTAIITGAGSADGIGRATARLFAEHGARVALTDLDAEGIAQAGVEFSGDHQTRNRTGILQRSTCDHGWVDNTR